MMNNMMGGGGPGGIPGGMGRGGGGMMMNGQGMQGMPNNAANQGSQAHQLSDRIILAGLQRQTPKPGWQQGIQMIARYKAIQGLADQLMQLGTPQPDAAGTAVAFETEIWNKSNSAEQYQAQLMAKTREIVAARIQNQNPAMQGQATMNLSINRGIPNGMPAQGFNPAMMNAHLQRQMGQANLGMPPQQPLGQPGMMMQNGGIPQNPQIPLNAQANILLQQLMTQPLTPEENQEVNTMAQNIYNGQSEQDRKNAEARLPLNEAEALRRQGLPPALGVARIRAKQQYCQRKVYRLIQQGGLGQQNAAAAQNLVNGMNGLGGRQGVPPGLTANALQEHVQSQQQNAIRAEMEGRPVVPASQQQPGQSNFMQNLPPHQQQAFLAQRAMAMQRQQQGLQQQNGVMPPGQMNPQLQPGRQNPQPPNRPATQQTPRPEPPKPPVKQPTPAPQSQQNTPRITQTPQQPSQAPPQPQQQAQSREQLQSRYNSIQAQLRSIQQAVQTKGPQLQGEERTKFTNAARMRHDQFSNQMKAIQAQLAILNTNSASNPTSTLQNPSVQSKAAPQPTAQQPATNPLSTETALRPTIPPQMQLNPAQRQAMMDTMPPPPRILEQPILRSILNPSQIRTWGDLKRALQEHISRLPPDFIKRLLAVQQQQFEAQLRNAAQRGPTQPIPQQQQQPSVQPSPQDTQPPQVPASLQQPPPQPTIAQPVRANAPPGLQAQRNHDMAQWIKSLPDPLTPAALKEVRARMSGSAGRSDEEIQAMIKRHKAQIDTVKTLNPHQMANLTAIRNGQAPPFPGVPVPPQMMAGMQSKMMNQNASSGQLPPQPQDTQTLPPIRATPVNNAQRSTNTPKPDAQMKPASNVQVAATAQQPTIPTQEEIQERASKFEHAFLAINKIMNFPGIQRMDPKTMAEVKEKLISSKELMQRSRNLFRYWYSEISPNDALLKQVLMFRAAVAQQYTDSTFNQIRDQYTITKENLIKATDFMGHIFRQTGEYRKRMTQDQAQMQQQSQQKAQINKPTEIKPTTQKNKADVPPAAPISETPPSSFHFAGTPPASKHQGVPIYHPGAQELTPDKLVIPDKKRKQPSAKTQSPPQAMKQTPVVKPESPTFKCKHIGCEFNKKGFPNGELLTQHIEDAHTEKEPEDGLEFALQMAKKAFGLDADGKTPKSTKMVKTGSAQPMKLSASMQGAAMSRTTTQTSNAGQPRTPQSMGRPDKPIPGKIDVSEPGTPDTWPNCPITPTELAQIFPTNEQLMGGLDIWGITPQDITGLTPASTLASGNSMKATPKSDVGDNALVAVDGGFRAPRSLFAGMDPDRVDYNEIITDFEEIDWDTAFPEERPAKRRRGQEEESDFRPEFFSLNWGNQASNN